MRNDIITRIETTLTPDGQGGWTEETIETGSFDVKLSIGANVEEATAYGVSIEQILKVVADVPLLENEASLYIIQGPTGKQGPAGSVAFDELTPEQMDLLRGPQGEKGEPGKDGEKGEKGDKGDKGDQGEQGPAGPKGADGTMTFEDLTAEQKESLKGADGKDGFSPLVDLVPKEDGSGATLMITDAVDTHTYFIANGKDGAKGEQGEQGIQGLPGERGLQGEQGPQGIQGEKGDKGDKGDTYTITDADYSAIADVVLSKMTNAEGVRY